MKTAVSMSEFRSDIGSLCRAVRRGKKELIVKRHNNDFFEVVKADDSSALDFAVSYARSNTGDFLEALEDHGTVTLSSHGRVMAKCVLIDEAIASREVKG